MTISTLSPDTGIPPRPPAPRLRLEYLDGLRALSALYVVLHHCWLEVAWKTLQWRAPQEVMSLTLYRATAWLAYGHYAVAIFIVLSGYCLMLPVARSADGRLRGGAWPYLKRRARRILPPYYAALALSLLLIALVPGMAAVRGVNWDYALPGAAGRSPSPGDWWSVLLPHLGLYHNLNIAWANKIDPPMWSVATEWQIYFLLPALFLPVWRRWGIEALLIAGFTVGIGLHVVFMEQLDAAVPWYAGLFTLGMAAAAVGFPREAGARAVRDRVPWGALAALLSLAFVLVAVFQPAWMHKRYIYLDTLVGAAAAALILYCTRSLTERPERPRPLVLRLLGARPTVGLGRFSYSLYLVHAPVLAALSAGLEPLGLTPSMRLAVLFGAGAPLAIGLSYVFHLAFERRFMTGFRREDAAEPGRAPAPGGAGD